MRWSRSTKYVLLVIIVLWYAAKASSADQVIQWKLMTKPVYFGQHVVLECLIQTEDKSAPMSWITLPNGKTIAHNKYPAHTDKYAVTVEYYERKIVYNLTIKHFNSTDINYVYRCDFGFHSYKSKILLNEKDFISEPLVREMKNFSIDNRKLHGIVMLVNGFPKPSCSGQFEGQEILKFMSISNKNISIFYETKIELEYITDVCTGTVNMTCSYGNYTTLITHFVDVCLDSTQPNQTNVKIILSTLAGFMLVGFCLSVYCYRKWQRERIERINRQNNSLL